MVGGQRRAPRIRIRPISTPRTAGAGAVWNANCCQIGWQGRTEERYKLWYSTPVSVTASEARKNLFPLIEKVNDDRTPIEITSRRGDAVLISRADYDALEETAYLLRAPKNARRLLESLDQAARGARENHDLVR